MTEATGTLTADLETFARLCGGRRPDSDRCHLSGSVATDVTLFARIFEQAAIPVHIAVEPRFRWVATPNRHSDVRIHSI